MNRKNELLVRAYMVLVAFGVMAVIVMVRLVNVNVVEGDKWRKRAGKNLKFQQIEADRGNIYAEDGNLLAASDMFFEIRMDMSTASSKVFATGIDSLSYLISKHLNSSKSPSEWKALLSKARNDYFKFKKPGTRNIFIAKNLNYEQRDRAKSFPIFRLASTKGGIIINKTSKRTKPFKQLAARTIGMDRENASKIGLEGYYDKFLRGQTSKRLMKNVGRGNWIPVYDPSEYETKRGSDIYTTLDMEIQDIVHYELLKMTEKQKAQGACAVVMEVETGAIKAISNLTQTQSGHYAESYNHAVGRSSEPGSTFKMVSALALLESNNVPLDELVRVDGGKKKFYDLTMYDSHLHDKTWMSFQAVIEQSSNVGIASLADKYYKGLEGKKKYSGLLDQFGIKDLTRVEIHGEPLPIVKDPVKNKTTWYGTTLPWMAHGYEVSLTPLQTLGFYNAVANDGVYMKPYLVKEIGHEAELVKKIDPKVARDRIASAKNIEKLQYLMDEVVQKGTGGSVKSETVRIAGKTGTARVNYTKQQERKKYNASFAGYFPADKPKYSMIVMFYDPKLGYYGGSVAGPVFKNIAEGIYHVKKEMITAVNQDMAVIEDKKMPKKHSGYAEDYGRLLSYIGIDNKKESKSKWVELSPSKNSVAISKKTIKSEIVPDVTGMGLRDAVYVLENMGMEVDIHGVGKVTRQSIKPGAKIDENEIELYLN